MKTRKNFDTMDQALFELQLAHGILAKARHSEASAKAVAEMMAKPLDTLFACLERLSDKA